MEVPKMQKKRVKTTFRPLPAQNAGPIVFTNTKFESSSSSMNNGFHKSPISPQQQTQLQQQLTPTQQHYPRKSRSPRTPLIRLPDPDPDHDPERSKPKLSTCVTFQRETDGRSSFPNQRDFQDFCKQRDLFYGIKEIWTLKQSDQSLPIPTGYGGPAQNYDPAFGKMRALFQLNSTATNLSRLSALFLSQCVLDSAYSSNQVGPSIAENNVRKILQSNPSKLEQLKQRVAPPEATVDFVQISDPMGFLKYFLSSANVPSSFTQYLMDRAVFEIMEVELSADQEISDEKEILDLMKKTRLLAKMLGYLYFAPYRQKVIRPSTDTDLHNQASLRSYQTPPLDLLGILQKAFAQNRLVFTLPWILEFLSQADPVTFFIPTYKPALNLISSIYQEILLMNHSTIYCIGVENRTFLRLYFDTLFEHEGVECFFKRKQEMRLYEFSSTELWKNHESEEPIDLKDSIGATLNPLCFNKQKKNIEILPDTLSCPPSPFPDRVTSSEDYNSIQRELETQFFQIYPPSMKKTVDFISERIASNFVKRLRNQILLDLKKSCQEKLVFGEDAVELCKLEIKKQQMEFCSERCRETIGLLVESGIEQVQTNCSQICQRKAEEKITEWVLKHVTKELFPALLPSVSEEPAEVETKSEPPKPSAIASPANATAPASVPFELLKIFHTCSQALHNGQSITSADIHTILSENGPGLLTQKQWIPNSTVTLAIEIATFQPALLNETLEKFITFWSSWNESEREFKVLCPRNLMLLAKSKNEKETWSVIGCLLKSLIKSGLVEPKNLEEQCLGLLRIDWPKNVSQNISLLLTNLVKSLEDRSRNSTSSSTDTEMIDWIAWYCSGQEDEV